MTGDKYHSSRQRSRSPDHSRRDRRHHHHHHHHHKTRTRTPPPPPVELPLNARALVKYDLKQFRSLLGLYLDIQKQIDIDELSDTEVKGRWKSFLGKWNRGELAEGWYDPVTKEKADLAASESRARRPSLPLEEEYIAPAEVATEKSVESDDEYAPSLPTTISRVGPAVPSIQDLHYRDELAEEDETARRQDLRFDRKMDRKLQKERFEEANPRAEPGSRERQLEKKRETAAANRVFRDEKSPGAEEVGESDLIGGEDGIKAHLKDTQRKKSERELRKEEIYRAREAEREKRLAIHRVKEDKTMEMLKSLARQRYG